MAVGADGDAGAEIVVAPDCTTRSTNLTRGALHLIVRMSHPVEGLHVVPFTTACPCSPNRDRGPVLLYVEARQIVMPSAPLSSSS